MMAWIPSHQELRQHPKTKRAARAAGTSLPAMIGHLHLLWWWALDHAADGDLSRYDEVDIADAALWDGDPEVFVRALTECGPKGSDGFLADGCLHDWDEYGGKYGKRVQAARKAAAVRWSSDTDANALRTHCSGNADAMPEQCDSDAEERRGEKKEHTSLTTDVVDDALESFERFWLAFPRHAKNGKPGGGGNRKTALARWRRMSADERSAALVSAGHYRQWVESPDGAFPQHATTWLNADGWVDWADAPSVSSVDNWLDRLEATYSQEAS